MNEKTVCNDCFAIENTARFQLHSESGLCLYYRIKSYQTYSASVTSSYSASSKELTNFWSTFLNWIKSFE